MATIHASTHAKKSSHQRVFQADPVICGIIARRHLLAQVILNATVRLAELSDLLVGDLENTMRARGKHIEIQERNLAAQRHFNRTFGLNGSESRCNIRCGRRSRRTTFVRETSNDFHWGFAVGSSF